MGERNDSGLDQKEVLSHGILRRDKNRITITGESRNSLTLKLSILSLNRIPILYS